jgi:hypothetical protein
MKTSLIAFPATLVAMQSFAGDIPPSTSAPMHRYMIERTFPAGALDGVDANVKKQVNLNNTSVSVRWVRHCEPRQDQDVLHLRRPKETAVRKAAEQTSCRWIASPGAEHSAAELTIAAALIPRRAAFLNVRARTRAGRSPLRVSRRPACCWTIQWSTVRVVGTLRAIAELR